MSEIRKHYFLDKYCVIANERGKRPTDFMTKKEPEIQSNSCPFCPTNESMTPPATVYKLCRRKIFKYTETEYSQPSNWNIRCFKNLYPALPGHEVIVESPDHNKQLAEFTDDEINLLMQVYRDRTALHFENKAKYVSIFRNYGKDAGASLSHPHSQVIPLPFIPPEIEEELEFIKESGQCPYCDIVKQESGGERTIIENDHWIVFAPYYSRSPFEMWILPKKFINNLTNPGALAMLGITLRDTLKKLKKLLNDPSYNYMVFQMDDVHYHMSIRIEPKLSIAGGFEKGTGVYINTMPPEEAARLLKETEI